MYWFIFLPLTALLMIFTVENKGIVEISLWPLPYVVSLPLSLIVLGIFFLGFFIGCLYAWGLSYKKRRELKNTLFQVQMLSNEIETLKSQQETVKKPLQFESH